MAWIEPITTWGEGDTYTYEDWNRVINDVEYLFPGDSYSDYYATLNTIPTGTMWDTIVNLLYARAVELLLDPIKPDHSMTAENYNALETLLLLIKEREDQIARQIGARIYAGDDLYVANDGQYTDISENYVR